MRIVFLDADAPKEDPRWRPLRALGRVWFYEDPAPGDVRACIKRAQILIARRTPISSSDLRACPDLRAVIAFGASCAHIDAYAARALGVEAIHTATDAADAEAVRALVFDIVAFLDGQPRHPIIAAN